MKRTHCYQVIDHLTVGPYFLMFYHLLSWALQTCSNRLKKNIKKCFVHLKTTGTDEFCLSPAIGAAIGSGLVMGRRSAGLLQRSVQLAPVVFRRAVSFLEKKNKLLFQHNTRVFLKIKKCISRICLGLDYHLCGFWLPSAFFFDHHRHPEVIKTRFPLDQIEQIHSCKESLINPCCKLQSGVDIR